jgi:capsular exopolysaccharide synthesis family protein
VLGLLTLLVVAPAAAAEAGGPPSQLEDGSGGRSSEPPNWVGVVAALGAAAALVWAMAPSRRAPADAAVPATVAPQPSRPAPSRPERGRPTPPRRPEVPAPAAVPAPAGIASAEALAAAGARPVLGVVPAASAWTDRSQTYLAVSKERESAAAYRRLANWIVASAPSGTAAVVQITSPSAGEGKTTTVANVAVMLASLQKRVVIMDCNLRRPRAHDFFGFDNATGLSSVIRIQAPLADVLREVPAQPLVTVLAAGPAVEDPTELLLAHWTDDLLDRLRERWDVVLIDSAAVNEGPDALLVAGLASSTVLVATSGVATVATVQRAVGRLRDVEAPLQGAILNARPRVEPGRATASTEGAREQRPRRGAGR